MITSAVLRSILRRWYVVIAGLLAVGLCYAAFTNSSSVYQSVSTVVFVSPGSAPITGVDVVQENSMVGFASMIERQMNDGRPVDRFASQTATLFGAGERQGYQVEVPNAGGQWNYYFPNPVLSVQVVGPTAEWVSATQSRLLDRITTLTAQDQDSLGVSPSRLITAKLSSSDNAPQPVGATHAMRIRGLLALLAVGIALSAAAATWLDRLLLRRRASAAIAPGDVGDDHQHTIQSPHPSPPDPDLISRESPQ